MKNLLHHIKKAIYSALLLGSAHSSAYDTETMLRQALIDFEAEEYRQTEDLLYQILKGSLSARERAIIQYNIGSTNLAKGNLEGAIDWLNQASNDVGHDYLLKYRIKRNKTIALYRQASAANDKEKLIYLNRETIKNSKQAIQAYCQLAKAEGYAQCTPPEDLENLKNEALNKLKEIGITSPISPMVEFMNAQLAIFEIEQEFLNKSETPESVLVYLIRLQELSLNLNRLAQEMEELTPQVQILLQSSQEFVKVTADLFLETVLVAQRNQFLERCQDQPWKKVLPIFDEGYTASYEAARNLNNELSVISLSYQEKALDAWRKTLSALKQEEAQPQEAEKAREQEKSFDTLLQNLQEMEKDDKSKPIENIEKKDVPKPW